MTHGSVYVTMPPSGPNYGDLMQRLARPTTSALSLHERLGGVMRLQGKVALITGAAHGMGATEANMSAKEGAKVVVADVLEAEGKQVVEDIAKAGGEALFLRHAVSKEEQWQKAVDPTVARFGKLDILVNNAGISGSSSAGLLDTAAWDTVMEVNAKGVFLGLKYAIPTMQKSG